MFSDERFWDYDMEEIRIEANKFIGRMGRGELTVEEFEAMMWTLAEQGAPFTYVS
jgi:hypothetical protein